MRTLNLTLVLNKHMKVYRALLVQGDFYSNTDQDILRLPFKTGG